MRKRTRQASVGIVAAMLLVGGYAHGQAGSDRVTARSLFDEARALVAAGKVADACPKFEESQRLDPGPGTLFNLADCYERSGRTATAWLTFLDVATAMRAGGQADREKAARDRAASLEPKLTRLRVVVPSANRIHGLEIKRDGLAIKAPSWDSAVPVDPGDHVVEASAPGRKAWKTTVRVEGAGATSTATVPTLEEDTTAPVPSSHPPPPASASATPAAPTAPIAPSTEQPVATPASDGSTQRMVGLVLGGAGVIGLGIGTVLAFGAKSTFNDGMKSCNGDACSAQGVKLREDAYNQGTVATVVGGIGLAALGGGALLYFLAPSGKSTNSSSSAQARWVVGPSFISYQGAF